MVNTILTVLEELDSQVFEKYDPPTNCLDSLYSKLFASIPSPPSPGSNMAAPHDIIDKDSRVVLTLCEWATTDQRSGMKKYPKFKDFALPLVQ